MPKLQQIIRANGSLIHSVNLPLEGIEITGWEKGDELIVKPEKISEGVYRFVIFREEDISKKGGVTSGSKI